MGIGSSVFTRRTEASARNVLELMHRPQAYNAGATSALPVDSANDDSIKTDSIHGDSIKDAPPALLRATPAPRANSSSPLSETGVR
jgi:hypothetical protein